LFGTSRMGSISNALITPAAPNPYYSWLPSKGKLAIFTGVVAFVAGGFYLLRTSRVRVKKIDNARSRSRQDTSVSSNPDEEKSFRVILNLLRSSETAKQVNALQTLHQKSRLSSTHDLMREVGVVHTLLDMLKHASPALDSPKHSASENEILLIELTKVVANLAAGEINRHLMSESGMIKDVLRLLDVPNEEVKENLLRTAMNLALSAENEDRIREEGGLKVFMEMFQANDISPTLLLQCARVLINLSPNETNKMVMIKAGATERVISLLLQSNIGHGLALRLVRLLGTFSTACDLAVYKQITDPAVSKFFISSLRKQMEADPGRDDRSYSEILLMAIGKITTEKSPKFVEHLTAFQNAFIEEDETDGSCGIDFIYPYLRLTTQEDYGLVIQCLSALQNLSRGNSQVQAKIRSGALNAIKELDTHGNPAISDPARQLVKSLSVIS